MTLWDEHAAAGKFTIGDKIAIMNVRIDYDQLRKSVKGVSTTRSSDLFIIQDPAAVADVAVNAEVHTTPILKHDLLDYTGWVFYCSDGARNGSELQP